MRGRLKHRYSLASAIPCLLFLFCSRSKSTDPRTCESPRSRIVSGVVGGQSVDGRCSIEVQPEVVRSRV